MKLLADFFDVVDTILEGDDDGVEAEDRRDLLSRILGVVCFHAEENSVRTANRRGITGHFAGWYSKRPACRLDLEPPLSHSFEVCSPGNEPDIFAGRSKFSPEESSDAAGTHDHEAHDELPYG
jgi:hypothetical protein